MVVGFYCIKSILSTETSRIKGRGTKTNNVLIQRPLDLIIAINLVKLKLFVDNVALLFCFVLFCMLRSLIAYLVKEQLAGGARLENL